MRLELEERELAVILEFLKMGQYSTVKELIEKIESQIKSQLSENRE